MPWITPSLRQVREMVRDDITSALSGAVLIGNSVLRVMSDANAGLAHLTMRYIDWLARQLMPDTAEVEWLDRHGEIWVGGRKAATYAQGTVGITGTQSTLIPLGTQMLADVTGGGVVFETTAAVYIGAPIDGPTQVNVAALTAGRTDLEVGNGMALVGTIPGVTDITISAFSDGLEEETDDQLRGRVLERIREPPMGGDAEDYVAWALQVPGVTRAWSSVEMGIGCVTVRFMMDDKYPDDLVLDGTGAVVSGGGFPQPDDIETVNTYLNTKRPVAVKDFFVEAPLAEPISFQLYNASADDAATVEYVRVQVAKMLKEKAAPTYMVDGVSRYAQTIYAAWVTEAALQAPGLEYFDLVMTDHTMPYNGSMGVLGAVTVSDGPPPP